MTFKVTYINRVSNKRDTMTIEAASKVAALAELRSANIAFLSVEALGGTSSLASRGRSGFHVMSSSSPSVQSGGLGVTLTLLGVVIVIVGILATLLLSTPE